MDAVTMTKQEEKGRKMLSAIERLLASDEDILGGCRDGEGKCELA